MDISRFTLVNQVSGGRFGAIWKARDPDSGREVALKQLALANRDRHQKIIAEAESAGRLRHPNIAATYSPVTDEKSIWLVEEWIGGASLALLSPPRAHLSTAQRLGVLHGALEGLAYAHRNGITHGSISPRTIMIDEDGTPRLVEFAARLGHPDAAGIGAYASPEAFVGEELSPASDVYSVGALLSEVVIAQAVADASASGPVVQNLQPVVDRAMATEPSQRHADAQALLDDLDRAAQRGQGALGWTTDGLGAIAASAAGATLATSGTAAVGGAGAVAGSSATAGSGGFGAVSGSINTQGAGAIGGAHGPAAGGGVLSGSVRQALNGLGRRGIIGLVAGGAALVVIAVSAVALTRDGGTIRADPAPGNSVPAATAPPSAGGPPTSTPAAAPTPTPSPRPTPTPNPARNFKGVYRYVSVVTKSTSASEPVGSRQTAAWSAETTCKGEKCTTQVDTGTGGKETLTSTGGAWKTRVKDTGQCINLTTNVPTGQQVPNLYARTLRPVEAESGQILKITGTDRFRQMKKCRNQQVKNYDVSRKITITHQG